MELEATRYNKYGGKIMKCSRCGGPVEHDSRLNVDYSLNLTKIIDDHHAQLFVLCPYCQVSLINWMKGDVNNEY